MPNDAKQKLIIIAGPTASGKSELAVRLAKKYNGEIISADSRQIYRGLDIATGKVPGRWRNGVFIYKRIPHYCIDCADPQKRYSVAEFRGRADAAIADIAGRGRLPIIAGGTGFWIDALVHGFDLPDVPPNPALRNRLGKKTPAELFVMLTKKDPKRATAIDAKNPHRLIRAIEIATALGRVPRLQKHARFNALWIGIAPPPEELAKKIAQRVDARIRAGMIAEARRLHANRLPWKRFYELGLAYKFLADHLRGKTSKKEFKQQLNQAIRHYAKRQITWFKRNRAIRWIAEPAEAELFVRQFLTYHPLQ